MSASRYFIAFAIDTSLGVALAVGLHKLACRLCRQRAAALPASPWAAWYLEVADCGSYGMPHVRLPECARQAVFLRFDKFFAIALVHPECYQPSCSRRLLIMATTVRRERIDVCSCHCFLHVDAHTPLHNGPRTGRCVGLRCTHTARVVLWLGIWAW